ncbi:UPF0235 protein C15orf40 homolog isoform X1 [Archocentrus centrarchus]|uniref:UPF0235 protein C15orf40 homolog isoform X1 n=1 Tax=Archocentrus centrarchus TaxID=63155 RepID=UPI0011E9E9E2|nr:UPF0235 protein C15orf40 homolog isoform X1 [Archocentrus centrarchus]
MFSRLGVPEALLCIKFLASLQQAGSVTSKAVTLPVLSCRYRLPPLSGVALHRRLYSGSRNRQMPQKVKGQKSDGGGAAIEACGPVTRDKNGAVTIKVHAKPGSKHSGITEVSAESVSVAISAPPTDGEANAELIRYLAEVLDMKKSHVSLDKGSRSRDKLIRVHASLSPEEVLKRLREAAG